MITPLEGIAQRAPEGMRLEYKHGVLLAQDSANPFDWSVSAAAEADVTVAFMGLAPLLEGEEGDALLSSKGGDRDKIEIPVQQVEYIKKLVIAGARIVLVLFSGSPIALGELENMVEGIIHVWYPGMEGGKAIADVLFGNATPSGKLPLTFPASTSQLPDFDDYSMDNRTYRYSTALPLYPFGFGLSYAKFEYSHLSLKKSALKAGESLDVTFDITNQSDITAEEVAQIYLTDVKATVKVPIHKLIGFKRVSLAPKERKTITFTVTPEMMMLVNDDGDSVLETGDFILRVGGSSPSKRSVDLGVQAPLEGKFNLA
jgi:beta-glucosidase